ncbi:DUF4124 domain-containing protein [Rugamonas sp. DEMB1]|uniref:DUF4124 domain-containing protein n=1 Tax=Rugamonas sp. DEMB1 TaxID=3039386 RepID=UPI00244B5E92|nr:DUF4124 domain-containing protein [Rugamonas sp. DEMB1]WGG48253.1 DUF4124 domain-containing protein [Rugamonas sp. DEMB1]
MKPDRAAGPAAASAAAKAAPAAAASARATRATPATTAATATPTPTPLARPRAAAWLAGALLLAACGQAAAQYVWIDDKGVKQLSDRPPPPSVPQKRILKAPGKDKLNPAADTAGENGADGDNPAGAAEAPAAKPAPTLGERNAAYNKRKAEAALAAQQAGEDSARKAEIAANCENARNNQRALDQGVRMSTYDKNGVRGFMSEAERAESAKKNKQVLAQCQ